MRLVSWNVNGIRACLQKGFKESVAGLDPDVLCVQETKMQPGQAVVDMPGYGESWHSAEKKGYSGTAVFSRAKPLAERHGIGIDEHDREGRVIAVDYPDFTLVNVYTPNSQPELARLEYRMRWDDAFREYIVGIDRQRPVVVCGDLNAAHREIDLANPQSNRRNAGFTDEERGKLGELLDAGFVDSFRALHPETRAAYTWWSFRANSRARNVGWRIDYFLVSRRLLPKVREARIHPDVMGSDHCPVELVLDLE